MNGPLLASVVIVVGLIAGSYVYLTDTPISGNLVKPKQGIVAQLLQEVKSNAPEKPTTAIPKPLESPINSTKNMTDSSSISPNKTKTETPVQTVILTQEPQRQVECSESWNCGEWSDCQNSQQSRACTDSNNCGTSKGKPNEIQICSQSPSPTQSEMGKLKIIGIKYDADGDDRKKENWNTEWVEVEGQGTDMSGWILYDSANHTFAFPSGFVISGLIKIKSGYGNNTQTELYFGDGPIWNNDGDTAYLKDKNGNLVDQYDYGG